MDIYALPGTKVVFAYPENGYVYDQVVAETYLQKGGVYTVARIRIDDWSSSVEFTEHPGVYFNTVLFADIP